MSKKLLSESTIRKFMKLANIEPLANDFLTETGAGLASKGTVGQDPSLVKEEKLEEGEEIVEEGMYEQEEEELDDMPADDMPVDAGMAEDDIEGLVVAIADAIESHTGVAVDVAGDEEAAPEMDAPAPEGEEGGEELPAPEGDEEEEVLEGFDMIDEDEVINETFRRVKSRLRKMQKEEQLLESLTNKIHARLSRKKSPPR